MAGVANTGERARLYAEQAIEHLDLSVVLSPEDMERIAAYGARAFADGLAAGVAEHAGRGWRR